MASIFLCHSSIDKPFVEKLARDLKAIGVEVWFDKWEIKIGDTLLWKIDEGIQNHDYMGVVLSPESVSSAWVKTEISSAWAKQMASQQNVVLPILYRTCAMPLFLQAIKYADFTADYQYGINELAKTFGIPDIATLGVDNWRIFARRRKGDWQQYRVAEYLELVNVLVDCAIKYNWSTHCGAKRNPQSISLHASHGSGKHATVSLKLDSVSHRYKASFVDEWNPNRIKIDDFTVDVGCTVGECDEFVWQHLEKFRRTWGDPVGRPYHGVFRHLDTDQVAQEVTKYAIKKMSWCQGDQDIH